MMPTICNLPIITVAVTGDRKIDDEQRSDIEYQVARVFELSKTALAAANESVRVISCLADGADQLVAQTGLDHGCKLVAQAECVIELSSYYDEDMPWDSEEAIAERNEGYEEANQQMLAESDLLIAIWDGEPNDCPGSTAQVVQLAEAKEIPVFWIDPTKPDDPGEDIHKCLNCWEKAKRRFVQRLFEAAEMADYSGNIAAARQLLLRANEFVKRYFGSNDPDLATGFSSLGEAERDMGNFAEAKRLFESAFEIEEKLCGPHHPNVAIHYAKLGGIERIRGNWSAAKRFFERTIEIEEKYYDTDLSSLVLYYSNLADLEQTLDNLPEAKRFYEKALEVSKTCLDFFDPELAELLYKLGMVEYDLGNTAEAMGGYLSRASSRWEEHLGDDDGRLVVTAYSQFAVIEQLNGYSGSLQEAKLLFEAAIRLAEKHFGPDYHGMADHYSRLGNAEHDLGNLTEAKQHYEKALVINVKYFAPDHFTFASIYTNLGRIERGLGNLAEAKRLFMKALEIDAKHFILDHSNFAFNYSCLSSVEEELGNPDEAIRLSRRAFLIFRQRSRQLKALLELARLRKIDPNIDSFLAAQGIVLQEIEKPEEL